MKGLSFTGRIEQFGEKGEKSGWTYILIPADLAQQLRPGNRKSFFIKGKLDKVTVRRVSVLPVGDGHFILPLNAPLRKELGKRKGAMVRVRISPDESAFIWNADFLECLRDDPAALAFFQSLPGSHRRYFSKWIDAAKTESTRVRRISQAVNALARQLGYGEMMRWFRRGE